jgi:tRNA(fMet)-specific endonuclease VapC
VFIYSTPTSASIAKHRPPEVRKRFETLPVGTVAMSLVTYGELRFGAEKSQRRKETLEKLIRLSELIPVRPLPFESARHYGRIRAKLERADTAIGANDLWIAAHALSENLTLVSNHTREFSRISELVLDNWIA